MHEKIRQSEYGGSKNNFHIERHDDTLSVELTYPPRTSDNPNRQVRYVEFDQESVRASDGIRVSYDYERDGYVIEQASKFEWDAADTVCDRDWQEVAFVQAWGRDTRDDDDAED